ncbi:hypothetical protein GIB67_039001 [Kingdonia uniflora]|uniref:Aminotransferase-like plant mobile domain-containing protein n=1 Tax=Kingdonia uniflora TaxID=39325 RepID=A0A7J7P7C3_9MAGN|nr:hypothetical protein GIB67_039001 [Kingdonia uniflora]
MNEKVPPTASNIRKRKLAREGDLVIYERKRKTIDPSTVIPPNTVDSANEGASEGVNIPTESAAEGEGATSNDDVGPSDKSLLRSFRFYRARSITLGQFHFVDIITIIAQEKLPIRVHHHQSTWDLRNEPQVVQDFVKLKGLDRIGAISYNYYNSALIFAFVERWQPKTNSFHFKWCKMTLTLDDAEQLVGLPTDGDATVIGGTWGFLAIIEVVWDPYRDKRDSPHAFKEVTFFYGVLASLDHVQPYYPNRVAQQFNREQGIPTNLSPNINLNDQQITALNDQLQKPKKDKEKESEANINLRDALKEKISECDLLKETSEQMKAEIELKHVVNEQCTLEFTDLPKQLDAKILEYKNLEAKNKSLEAELRSKSCKEIESLKAVNTILMEQIDIQLPPTTPLVVLQSHQPVPDTTLAKKYEDLLAAHEDVKKKLITKEDFINNDLDIQRQKLVNAGERMKSLEANNSEWHKKLVNSEERKKTLEVNNNEWEVWHQALKKALESEGMGDMGDPTFEELFEHNERFFTITQQGPKGDYQENLVSTAVTL